MLSRNKYKTAGPLHIPTQEPVDWQIWGETHGATGQHQQGNFHRQAAPSLHARVEPWQLVCCLRRSAAPPVWKPSRRHDVSIGAFLYLNNSKICKGLE